MNSTILVYVDDVPVYVPPSSSVIQACEKIGVIIPRFCYHDLLEIAGNCRMCLVEIEKSPKPQAACGLPVLDQIRIYTNTPLVKKAREGVLEFLLLNHPLDCPICDQGGACDLQNQALKYGNTRSRFYNFKRGVEDKGLGPIIKTVITRCIHCTRCVRFAWDIAGVEDLGTSLRGNQTEVGTYVKKTFNSEVSGNVIDLCPVGALTSKVHAFKTRPWEVKSTQSIDTSDSCGSNIVIESKRGRAIRILPRPNKKINDEWLSDKGRFIYEGYISIRLAYHYFSKNGKYFKFSSFLKTKKSLNNFLINSYIQRLTFGRNLDLETLNKGLDLSKNLGIDFESETPFNIQPTIPAYFQSTLALNKIDTVDSCLLLGVNPRTEATIANLRLRSRFKAGLFKVLNFGCPVNLTYPSKSLGIHIGHLYSLVLGKHTNSLLQTKKPLLIYGDSLTKREDAFSAFNLSLAFQKVKQSKNWNAYLRLPLGSNSIGKSFYGLAKPVLKNYKENVSSIVYCLGVEDNKTLEKQKEKFIVETTHVTPYFKNCSFVLPQQSILEKNGSFINCNGLVQKSSNVLRFGVNPLTHLENFCNSLKIKFAKKSKILFNSYASSDLQKITKYLKIKVYTTPLKALLGDIFRTDRCTNASLTLAKLSSNWRKIHWNFLEN